MKANTNLRAAVEALTACFQTDDQGLSHVVDLAVLIASADERIDSAEMATLSELLESIIGSSLDRSVIRYFVLASFKQTRAVGAEARAKGIGAALAEHEAVEQGLRLAFAVAMASEGVSDVERRRIDLVAQAACADPALVERLAQEVSAA